MSQHPISVSTAHFSLAVSGVAGFFGGDEVVEAMKTIHLCKARRWTGWYNTPGSFAIAKSLGPIANSRFWNALFPGPNLSPETAFGLDNQSGPKYIASQSGTIIDKTTHAAYLVTQRSKEENNNNLCVVEVEGRRKSQSTTLTVVEVKDVSTAVQPSAPAESKAPPTITLEEDTDRNEWMATIPISGSLIACALCAYSRDWYCLAMIFLGIISNGLTCLVVGSALVTLKGVRPATHAPPGDGMLMDDSSNHVVILKGAEGGVNWVTKGRFCLEYLPSVWMKKRSQETASSAGTSAGANSDSENDPKQQKPAAARSSAGTSTGGSSDPEHGSKEKSQVETHMPEEYRTVGLCSLLLGIQSLLQLLIIPQGTLFGQIVFLSSFVISWAYNLYLASLEKEKIQQKLLFNLKIVEVERNSKYKLCTRTTAAVFATLVLRPPSPLKSLKCFVPNETALWEEWRKVVGSFIEGVNWTEDMDENKVVELLSSLRGYNTSLTGFSEEDQLLLRDLLNDAEDAFRGYYYIYLRPQGRGTKPSSFDSRGDGSSVLDTERQHATDPGISQDVEAVENPWAQDRSYSGSSTGTCRDDRATSGST